ncbi:MAG: cytochrome c oxidase assembly protein [Anaerolineae bacterium]
MADFWNAWSWNPIIGALLALAGWRYMDGVWRLWRRAGTGRGVRRWQVAAFWGGWIALFIALISPLETYSTASLAMHMIQHLLLMLIAPPLLVLGLPPRAVLGMIPMPWRHPLVRWWQRQTGLRQLWHMLTETWVAWGVYALVLWGWHLPPLYQLAVENTLVHMLEHASFFGAAFLFWQGLEAQLGLGVLAIFTTAVHSSILGALMTFSTQIWYPVYGSLEDQQIAGLIMWMPGGIIFVIAGLVVMGRWLHEMEVMDAKNRV